MPRRSQGGMSPTVGAAGTDEQHIQSGETFWIRRECVLTWNGTRQVIQPSDYHVRRASDWRKGAVHILVMHILMQAAKDILYQCL